MVFSCGAEFYPRGKERKSTFHENFKAAAERISIKGRCHDQAITVEKLVKKLVPVIFLYAFSRCSGPAVKTSSAAPQINRGKINNLRFNSSIPDTADKQLCTIFCKPAFSRV